MTPLHIPKSDLFFSSLVSSVLGFGELFLEQTITISFAMIHSASLLLPPPFIKIYHFSHFHITAKQKRMQLNWIFPCITLHVIFHHHLTTQLSYKIILCLHISKSLFWFSAFKRTVYVLHVSFSLLHLFMTLCQCCCCHILMLGFHIINACQCKAVKNVIAQLFCYQSYPLHQAAVTIWLLPYIKAVLISNELNF